MRINEKYITKKILDAYILINVESNADYVVKLNNTSFDIINYIKDGKNQDEIVELLYNKYDVDKNKLANDVDHFISEMIAKNIIINS